jgi:hypothetical protein
MSRNLGDKEAGFIYSAQKFLYMVYIQWNAGTLLSGSAGQHDIHIDLASMAFW